MQKVDYPNAWRFGIRKRSPIDPESRDRLPLFRHAPSCPELQKYEIARDRYVEAYIAEPYNKFSAAGLTQWAQITKNIIGHPRIEIPVNVTTNDKGERNMNIPANMITGPTDGSNAWILYWRHTRITHGAKKSLPAQYPNEKEYRHSLAEEAAAHCASLLPWLRPTKKVKTLNPSLAKLKKVG